MRSGCDGTAGGEPVDGKACRPGGGPGRSGSDMGRPRSGAGSLGLGAGRPGRGGRWGGCCAGQPRPGADAVIALLSSGRGRRYRGWPGVGRVGPACGGGSGAGLVAGRGRTSETAGDLTDWRPADLTGRHPAGWHVAGSHVAGWHPAGWRVGGGRLG